MAEPGAKSLPPIPPTDTESDPFDYAKGAKAENTKRSYRFDQADFQGYCRRRGASALPADPEIVAAYLRYLGERRRLKMTTVARRLAAVGDAHREAGLPSPCDTWVVRNTLRRLRRELGAPPKRKAPLLISDLRRIMKAIPDTLSGFRDRALLLLGFAGAMRRSELVSLDLEHLALANEGIVVTIARSKTDQRGNGRTLGVPYGQHLETCPVKAVLDWIEAAKLSDGPLFRPVNKHGHLSPTRLSGDAVATLVKKHTKAIGKQTKSFAGHSLRSGLATTAALAGVPERTIQNQTGHRSTEVLRRYIQDATVFRLNAASMVGL